VGPRRCPVCGRFLPAFVRARRRLHYDRAQCARQAKLDRDRQYQREARRTTEGRTAKRVENEATRDGLGWAEYLRFWRKAHPEDVAELNRRAARRYYHKHRAQILAQRRLARSCKKAAPDACSQ
jgi:hypothetical protein